MAKQGRPPKPTALKIMTGNPGKRPLNDAEPTPDPLLCEVEPPEYLTDAAKTEWRRVEPQLRAMKLLTKADLSAFEAYCICWGEWQKCLTFMREHGDTMTMRDDKGSLKWVQSVPQFGMAQKWLEKVQRYQREFGLTPSARAGLKVEKGGEQPQGLGGLSKPKVG